MHWHPDYEFLLIKDGVLVRDDYGGNNLLKKKAGSESNLRACSLYILPPTPAPELKPNIRHQMMSMVDSTKRPCGVLVSMFSLLLTRVTCFR